jgi:hypothetical protein
MLEDGRCPHCGGPVTEITTVTPLGKLMDAMSLAPLLVQVDGECADKEQADDRMPG